MSEGITWGPEIAVNGKRPEWLADDDRMQCLPSPDWKVGADWVHPLDDNHAWACLTHIRLPADHPHYAAQEPRTAPSGGEVGSEVVDALRGALTRSVTALNDWLATYADDLCDPEHVATARARIAEFGTLAYIAEVQQQNRAALALLPEPVDADRVEAVDLLDSFGEAFPDAVSLATAAIKRGRALEKGEAADG